MVWRKVVKPMLHTLVQDYRANVIVANGEESLVLPTSDGVTVRPMSADDPKVIACSPTKKMRGTTVYAEAGQIGFVLTDADGIQCVAHFAPPGNYDYHSTWPLRPGELCLVNIATEERAWGKGYAPQVISTATHALLAQGTQRLTAFIWWSNTPSRRAFAKAGWREIGWSFEVKLLGRWYAWRRTTRS